MIFRQHRYLVLGIRMLLLAACLVQVLPASEAADALVKQRMQQQGLPGAVYVVTRQGAIISSGAFGMANVELSVPMGMDSVLQIGSITKQFAARAILILVDEGKLRLRDPLNLHLPRSVKAWEEVTIEHVLTHSSGIPNWTEVPGFSFYRQYSEDEFLDMLGSRHLDFRPGDKFRYSSAAYSLLAMVIEKVSGQTFATFLRDRVFKPAGMQSTAVNDDVSLVEGRASGYVLKADKMQIGVNLRPSVTAASGAVLSTALDLARYENALMKGQGLTPESNQSILKPARLRNGELAPYGFGWQLKDPRNVEIALHSGGTNAGFRAAYVRHLRSGISVIFLCNATGDGVDPVAIAESVAALFVRP